MASNNPWFSAVEQTLPEYVPLPMQELMVAGNAVQGRHDTNMANLESVGQGLASIEARLPGHREYVNKLASGYRSEVDDLLKRYNNNATDPQFNREFSRIKSKYANDKNLSTIMMANEGAKRNEELGARLSAEGKLYINNLGTGLDERGNLISTVAPVRQVNTLDEIDKSLKAAASQSTEVGNLITNRPSLDNAKRVVQEQVKNGDPAIRDLIDGYKTRGLSEGQAIQEASRDIQSLLNTYNPQESTNFQKLNYGLALQNNARENQAHAMKMRVLKAELNKANGIQSSSGVDPKGVIMKGIVSSTNLNKDKLELVKNFKSHVDAKGNLNIKNNAPFGNQNPFSPTGSVLGGKNSERLSSGQYGLMNNSAMETLNYMRGELGWTKTKGSAKQVADAYESMVKSDNLTPIVYKTGNATISKGLETLYGSDFAGADYYIDGTKKQLKADDIEEVEKSAKLQGISMVNGGSVIFRSLVGGKPVNITIPLDETSKRLFDSNLTISKILDSPLDNKEIMKAAVQNPRDYLIQIGQNKDTYVARKTAGGIRYAKVRGDGNSGIELDRDSKSNLQYLDDSIVEQALNKEYSDIDTRLEQIIK